MHSQSCISYLIMNDDFHLKVNETSNSIRNMVLNNSDVCSDLLKVLKSSFYLYRQVDTFFITQEWF